MDPRVSEACIDTFTAEECLEILRNPRYKSYAVGQMIQLIEEVAKRLSAGQFDIDHQAAILTKLWGPETTAQLLRDLVKDVHS